MLAMGNRQGHKLGASLLNDAWVLGAIAVGLALRLIHLGAAALWLDETFTATWVQMPWQEMLRAVLSDNHLPLYPVLMKLWCGLAGTSASALRLPSVLFSLAMIPVIAQTAERLSGRNAARWAAWLTALSPYLLQHAQDARMYALIGLLCALLVLQMTEYLTGELLRLGSGFLVCNLLLLATHYYAVFFIGAEGLVLIALSARQWRSWALVLALSCLAAVLPFLAAKYLATPHAGGQYEMGWFALPGLIWSLISGYVLLPTSAELHAQGARAAMRYLPVALPAALSLAFVGVAALRGASRTLLAVCGLTFACTIFGPFLVSSLFDVGINPRYAMAAMPGLIILLAAGCARMSDVWFARTAPGLVVAVMILGSLLHLHEPGHGREDMHAATRWLDDNVPQDEEILVSSHEMGILAHFYWPQRKITLYPGKKVVATRDSALQLAADLPLRDHPRVIYVFGREWLSDPDGALRAALRAKYESCQGARLRGIEIFCLKQGS
jgi:uncharacterized membrane protein